MDFKERLKSKLITGFVNMVIFIALVQLCLWFGVLDGNTADKEKLLALAIMWLIIK